MLGTVDIKRMLVDEHYTILTTRGEIISGICVPNIRVGFIHLKVGKIGGSDCFHAVPIPVISMVLSLSGLEIMCELGELE